MNLWKNSHDPFYPCPTPVLAGIVVVPLIIAYLVHIPNTRLYRMALWPIGMMCYIWGVKGCDLGYLGNLRPASEGSSLILGFATYWAFTDRVPQYHPLPRSPPFPWLRSTRLFKAFDLTWNHRRFVNIDPFWPPLQPSKSRFPWVSAMAYHTVWLWIAVFLTDLGCYLPWRFAPDTFGSLDYIGGDYHAWVSDLSSRSGVPSLGIKVVLTIGVALCTHFGMTVLFHGMALMGIGLGLHLPEEWPDITQKPMLSTSLNELWSKRWHQQMRFMFLTLARPFERLGRTVHLLSIFTISGIFHVVIFYAPRKQLTVYPYMIFYIAQGLGCIAERAFYKATGRRVVGVVGWIWTWTFMYISAIPTVEHEYSSGWVGVMRDVFAKEPQNSLVVWAVYALGWGPHPMSYHRVKAE